MHVIKVIQYHLIQKKVLLYIYVIHLNEMNVQQMIQLFIMILIIVIIIKQN